MYFVPFLLQIGKTLEPLEIEGWEIPIGPCERKAPQGHCAAIHVEYSSIHELLPYVHEAHLRHFGDIISFIDDTDPSRKVRIEFTVTEMGMRKMETIVSELFVQAIAMHDQRESSRRMHPSTGIDSTLAEKQARNFRNVPPQVRGRF